MVKRRGRLMLPSSRTPEGLPQRCPVCGNEVRIEPSAPPGDAPCPFCGCLLWFAAATTPSRTAVEHIAAAPAVQPPVPIGLASSMLHYEVLWSASGTVTGMGIGLLDRSVLLGVLWAAVSVAFGVLGIPRIARLAERLIATRRCFWRDVVLGWVLVPGPIAACFAGLLPPFLWDWPGSAFESCLLGLAVGPIFAAVEGLVIVCVLVVGIWAFTGKRLDLMQSGPASPAP
jgi:hypothetical protein